jgi:phytoene dehydrogenase-like protein
MVGQLQSARADVAVIGAGHNGLVAATLLARAGLDVIVLEERDTVGGAAKTERPFPRLPDMQQSTGAYLLGLMPPEVLQLMQVDLPLLRRDPHYFLPTTRRGSYLMYGTNATTTDLLTDQDLRADAALQDELAMLREDIASAWLQDPLSIEETAERFVRPRLRDAFVRLCRGSVADYLARFDFETELLVAMYVVTDGMSGLTAGPDTPGSGHNFLAHNMCRLPGAYGTWMIVRGGMGTVSGRFADAARAAGVRIETRRRVEALTYDGTSVGGVRFADGTDIAAPVVLGACDPFRLAAIAAADGGRGLPSLLQQKLDGMRRPGTTLKVNLALNELPQFFCLSDGAPSPHGATVHLLPQEQPLHALRRMWADVENGRLPEEPTIEWYLHTTVDPVLRDRYGHHSSALFVQSVPYDPIEGSWDQLLPGYVDRLLAQCDRFAPGTSRLVADTFALSPPGIEEHFGITAGHIHHVDNTIAFADRMPYATGVDGLYAGSAGCHPAGSVVGAAGVNAARRIATDLGLAAAFAPT